MVPRGRFDGDKGFGGGGLCGKAGTGVQNFNLEGGFKHYLLQRVVLVTYWPVQNTTEGRGMPREGKGEE